MMNPTALLANPFLNKGTAFSIQERSKYHLTGLIPPQVETIAAQAARAYHEFLREPRGLNQREFLMRLFNTNRTLFFYLFGQHIAEMMPVVYDPVIADAIEHYSDIYMKPQGAAFLSIDHPENIRQTLQEAASGRDIHLIVVTDAEAILGIGDWGVNGVEIAIGKLMVYTAAAGINPEQVLPVILDTGTENNALLKDPRYLGNRHHRIRGARYDQFIDQFVTTAEPLFNNLYLHWEDFGRGTAAAILARYQDQILTFNDDIQGTGIITLAGILGALKISGEKLTDQTYLCFGAGSAGAGITDRIYQEMRQQGLSEATARAHFYLVDRQGLLFNDDPNLTPAQRKFARSRSDFSHPETLTSLAAVVAAIHPTILVGTSTVTGAFTEKIVREMAAHTARPIIFPLSNPTKLAEATAEDLITWTDGRALVATGVPAEAVTYGGVQYHIGQANNALVYPGLGLGAIAVHASRLSDPMISAAAHSLSGIVDPNQPGAAVLPPVDQLQRFSNTIAVATAKAAVTAGLNQIPVNDVTQTVTDTQWHPAY
ncbi:NAD-dependent malic enzyme [Levilactobacillus bambusae]|uniref:NAD-dependent malic enzyme n=2 Tax=Levilactobacillus bambusae TaxID=2024736 RepID=A0A2V1MZ76_9LACO|nr:malolactic enzyme [Levilactobacillus bambusae]PWG00267.1 NAD-dependent malic enzyme [Levilactobacillus bambusae]